MAEVGVLIPTLGRAEKLQPLLDNIHETTLSSHTVYLIVENSDRGTIDKLWELRKGEHICVFGTFGSCARAMNAGYEAATEPYLFTGNDDLRFHEGWDIEALSAMSPSTHIVGTNDANGRMTCFALVRREYIEEESGVFDHPRTLWHDYEHQYCDTELAEYAKYRGVWGEAPEAVTEHLHWEFGKADPNHPSYQKAQATCGGDHRQYEARKRAWESVSA